MTEEKIYRLLWHWKTYSKNYGILETQKKRFGVRVPYSFAILISTINLHGEYVGNTRVRVRHIIVGLIETDRAVRIVVVSDNFPLDRL